jgi:antitoxin component of MazEF toxin-antitoxin module
MLHSQQFVESLIELLKHYQALQEEHQCSSAHVKEQLAHVNALLVDQLVLQHHQQPVSIKALTVNENPALTQATFLGREESPTALDEVDELAPDPIAEQQEVADAMNSNQAPTPSNEQDSPELDSKKADGYKRQRRKFSSNSTEEMLPRYQQLNFTEAVEAVVQENAGEILTTDKVARTLYGELSGQALTKAKEKVGKTLWSGANQKRWQRVPGQMGAYTLNMQLVAPTELG